MGLLAWLDPVLNPLACLPPGPAPEASCDAGVFLRQLEKQLRLRLRDALSGGKTSLVRGQGLDFADLREYAPGDDIRKIDWNVFARTLTPHVKEFHEEKQLTLWLAVDLSPSMHFGRERTKAACAVEWAGLLALMAHAAGHKLGAFLIAPDGTWIIPPKPGYGQVRRVAHAMLDLLQAPLPVPGTRSDPGESPFQALSHVVGRHGTVFLLSDFNRPEDAWRPHVGQLSRRAALISLLISDPAEERPPSGLDAPVYDPVSGLTVRLDSRDAGFLRRYESAMAAEKARLRETLKAMGLLAEASTEEDPLVVLRQLLGQAQRVPWR